MRVEDVDFSKLDYSDIKDEIEEINNLCLKLKKNKNLMKKIKNNTQPKNKYFGKLQNSENSFIVDKGD